MKTIKLLIFLFMVSFLAWALSSHAEKDHKHSDGKQQGEGNDSKKEDHDNGEDHREEEHGHKEEEASGNVGPGKAVEEAREETGIRLSTKALKRLGIKTIPAPQNPSAYPASALVKYQEETGIYQHRQGWFKLVPLDQASFEAGDEIVVSGAALLRAAELDAFGGGEEGHGH